MQEELIRLSHECNKKVIWDVPGLLIFPIKCQNSLLFVPKDDENSTLSSKLKEVEEERTRLQKTTNVQQTQIEKQKALAEESNRKCEGLQQQVVSLQKVVELFVKYY